MCTRDLVTGARCGEWVAPMELHSKATVSHVSEEIDLASNITNNLQSSSRTTGLYSFDPEAVLKKLSADRSEETRGYNSARCSNNQ